MEKNGMENNKPERVVLRIEHDPYMEIDKVLVVFPDEPAWFGRLACQDMWFDGNGKVWFDTFDACDVGYYWKTKPLKDKELADKCKAALETRYEQKFKVMQKIMWGYIGR